MKSKYYVSTAYDVGFGHADELHLIRLSDGLVVGYLAEFDSCTTDIVDACSVENASHAKWFGWNDEWEWRPATLEELKDLGLGGYLIGSKTDMKISTPIDPL